MSPHPDWSGRFCCLDFESTGTDVEADRVVTAAFVDLVPRGDGSYDVDRWDALADPGVDIPAAATEIHGVSTARARAEGRPAADVIADVADLVESAWAAGAPIVGHSVGGYDITLLDREMRRHHGRGLTTVGPVIDTLVMDRAVDRWRRGSRRLGDVCTHYDVRLDGAHDATEDALAAARVAWRIARRYPQVGAMSLAELHDWQREAHAAWAVDFAEYLRARKRRDGESQAAIDAVDIATDWPLRAVPVAAVKEAA